MYIDQPQSTDGADAHEKMRDLDASKCGGKVPPDKSVQVEKSAFHTGRRKICPGGKFLAKIQDGPLRGVTNSSPFCHF